MIDLRLTEFFCNGCHGCKSICPQNCISMISDDEGFLYPHVDYNKCIKCTKCVNICPVLNKKVLFNKPKAYAVINKNLQVRMNSSSGGVFSVFAQQVIEEGGYISGAVFDDNLEVIHILTNLEEKIACLRKSKYVQSRIDNIYKEIKIKIESKQKVFFVGTPCQVAGLKNYLEKDYAELITADIICHGVPSPKVLKKYLNYIEKKVHSNVVEINFRDKTHGWRDFEMFLKFDNKLNYRCGHSKDLFMLTFLKDLCLRPSCYSCAFKDIHRQGDITLADCWGAEFFTESLDDNKGISLILMNSERGVEMFEKSIGNLKFLEVDLETAIKYNPSAVKSVEMNANRDNFFRLLDKKRFNYLVEKFCKKKIVERIKDKLKKLIMF
jgi:coenzyme F420-reducing hydrogenase beta subunit